MFPTQKARIVAEATIIRSLSLFDLARTWGNIPVIKQATSSPTQLMGLKQTQQKKVYQIVIMILEVFTVAYQKHPTVLITSSHCRCSAGSCLFVC
jgi:hypothetical protein